MVGKCVVEQNAFGFCVFTHIAFWLSFVNSSWPKNASQYKVYIGNYKFNFNDLAATCGKLIRYV